MTTNENEKQSLLEDFIEDFFKGLQTLSEASFPKKCKACNKVYTTVDDFVRETKSPKGASGLDETADKENKPIVTLYRNCVCGSILMDCFNNRRDLSKGGRKRRRVFEMLLGYLVSKGLEMVVARQELIRILNGEKSDVLDEMGIKKNRVKQI
jgi:hypothetical protein